MKLNPLLLRRIGGVVLLLAGAYVMVGPIEVLIGGTHGAAQNADVRHHILDAMIYQLTLGGVLLLFGAWFLTKTPQKFKQAPTAKPDAAD